ncbi:MAG: ABC transporter ATP-binding protein [Deinococcota bacterium]
MDVTLSTITKSFGAVTAVDDLSLNIHDGELIALLGPSGCGKTTILFSIAGIYKLNQGQILFGGKDVSTLPSQQRNVGVVFQAYALYPHMTVFDNIAFPLKLRNESQSEIKRKVHEMAELTEIAELLKRRPAQLSGGQQQRVSLARALVRNPSVLLLDEPLSNLDARLRTSMRAEIKRLQRETGVTTILVTHDQVEATTMADRIVCMNKGTIAQVGQPFDIYDSPQDTFVAGFIGSPPITFIQGDALQGMFSVGDVQLPCHTSLVGDATLALRPEFIELGCSRDMNSFEGVVSEIEPMGREILYHLNTPLGKLTALETQGRPSYTLNQPIAFSWSNDKALWFDSTGKRVTA